jgi:1,4-alpha-glucan branching enzyme
MRKAQRDLRGYITLTLHSHLPYVVNHGTWPHGLEWLHEAAAETYLPLLRVVGELEAQGVYLKPNVNLSPILLEQLSHPVFKAEFPKYATRKIEAARKDHAHFTKQGEKHFTEVAEFWLKFYEQALADFESLGGDIIAGFRRFDESGAIEVITCAATHGYFPLLGHDACIRAQLRTGVATHKKHLGKQPRGIWVPECGYRPAGMWNYPVSFNGFGSHGHQPFMRMGVEQALGENGIEYFFVDTHLIETSALFTPYELLAGDVPVAMEIESPDPHASVYRPYFTDGPSRSQHQVAFFPRDPRTGLQVWSGETGYPGDAVYLDFHKKRWPGGLQYWQVTHPKVDLAFKTAYYPQFAQERTKVHAAHFAQVVRDTLATHPVEGTVPVLTAPFDAELFGHWWFEGPEWLKNIALEFAKPDSQVELISCGEYLDAYPPDGFLPLPEGSWGKNGTNEVWLNPDTAWTWTHIYPAEQAALDMIRGGKWKATHDSRRLAKQICRELLLLESSDWQFLITTGAARDYAEKRFTTHLDQFNSLIDIWRRFEGTAEMAPEQLQTLEKLELRDGVFADVNPEDWL